MTIDQTLTYEELKAEVIRAMQEGELVAYYQPQFDSLTHKLKSAEALTRWIKKDGTVIFPGDFLPKLEEHGDICMIDWHILEEACRLLALQRERGIHRVPIAVNFSRLHVYEENFLEHLCAVVDQYHVHHEHIEVEITETAYVESPNKLLSWVSAIRKAGFKIAIDDFGNGLSSLDFVTKVDADVIKIDKSLLDGNLATDKERIILESIFDFAHRLKLKTVAEGVETNEQLGFLRSCDCKLIQGYLFARPMPEKDFIETCIKGGSETESEDILVAQAPSSASHLLFEVLFKCYPLVIFANLSRNSFYMMAYESFTAQSCPATGNFDDLIEHGTLTMHPEDQALFHDTFQIENLMSLYRQGHESVTIVTRQQGDDGIYRRVETTDYFVKNPSVDDLLVITLCKNLD